MSSPVDEPELPPARPSLADAPGEPRIGSTRALQDRYGRSRRRPSRRTRIALYVCAVAATVALAGWAAVAGADEVTWADINYRVEDETTTVIVFDVTMEPGTTAVCTARALNAAFADVGLADVVVGPSTARTVRVTTPIPTSERAVTGTVKACVPRES